MKHRFIPIKNVELFYLLLKRYKFFLVVCPYLVIYNNFNPQTPASIWSTETATYIN